MRRLRLLPLLLLGLVSTGCLDALRPRQEKPPGSAVWINSSSGSLGASDVARLKESGVGEAFVRVAALDLASADGPVVRAELPELPPAMPVTLVLGGVWEGGAAESTAAEVAEALRQLRFDVEARGEIAVGVHLDLTEVDSFASYSSFLEALRDTLDPTLFLSVTLQRNWLDAEGIAEVAEAVDFVVPFLYGQRVREAEDGAAWDFVELERRLQVLEDIGTPYVLGVVSLGTATHTSGQGGVKGRRTGLSLQEILWNQDLRLEPGFSLEGVNRRVYAVKAEKRTRVGKWELQSGEMIRVVRAATSDLEELLRLTDSWANPGYLGQVYYRLPSAEEHLSLSLENLLNALDPEPATPALELGVHLQRRTGRGWLLRFSIQNTNGEITELSLMDSNYLQATAVNGHFGHSIKAGDFLRFDLYQAMPDGELERTFRSPNLVRFFVPILEGQQTVTTGDVELRVRGAPELLLAGQFMLADGRSLEIGPRIWRDGGFLDEAAGEDPGAE